MRQLRHKLISYRRAQTPILDGLDRIERMVSTLVVAQPAFAPLTPAKTFIVTATGNTVSRVSPRSNVTRTTSHPWISGRSWEPWGLRGSSTATQAGPHTDYNINFSVPLPLARILGSYALTGCLSLSVYRGTLTFRNPSYFAVARVVEDDHPFMLACCTGDLETLRAMLRSGEGRPADMTSNGKTPMAVSHPITEYEYVLYLCKHSLLWNLVELKS